MARSVSQSLDAKCRKLERTLASMDRIGVAFSGGADSAFIAWFAKEQLGKSVAAFFVDSAFVSAREKRNALRMAEWLGLGLDLLEFDPLGSASVRENPVDRCYFCKRQIFGLIRTRAAELGCPVVVDGSHAGDAGSYRPGKRALAELGIVSPLALAGLVKEEIRSLARDAAIPNWNKPSESCLATRVPYGTALSRALLAMIERAEDFLRDLGLVQVRVRCHGGLARIEAEPSAFDLLLGPGNRTEVVRRLGELGFSHVSLDLAGFRSGSWDAGLDSADPR